MRLVLHERRARQEVERLHVVTGEAPVEGAEKRQVLLQGDGHLGVPEGREELQQHPGRTRHPEARVKPGRIEDGNAELGKDFRP
jgi:hypothetical protein